MVRSDDKLQEIAEQLMHLYNELQRLSNKEPVFDTNAELIVVINQMDLIRGKLFAEVLRRIDSLKE